MLSVNSDRIQASLQSKSDCYMNFNDACMRADGGYVAMAGFPKGDLSYLKAILWFGCKDITFDCPSLNWQNSPFQRCDIMITNDTSSLLWEGIIVSKWIIWKFSNCESLILYTRLIRHMNCSRHMIRGKVILTCQMIFYMMIFSHVLDAQVLCRS